MANMDKRASMRVQQCVARRDGETLAKKELHALKAHEWERAPDIAKRGEMATRCTDCTRHISGPASLCTTARDYMYITATPSSRTRASLCTARISPSHPFLFLFLSLAHIHTSFFFLFLQRYTPPDCRRTAKTDEIRFEL